MKQTGHIKKKPIPFALRKQLQNPRNNVFVKDFHGVNWHEKTNIFPIFTVYYSPSDFPKKYVVRLFDGPLPTRLLVVKDTLEEARAAIPQLPPLGFVRMERSESDIPEILETWL